MSEVGVTTGSQSAKATASSQESVDPRVSISPSTTEWIVVVASAAAGSIALLMTSRDLWFFSDIWPTLGGRNLTSFDRVNAPHGGHWLVPSVVGTRLLYRFFGMDYWPWYFLPPLVGHSVLALAWWRILRWRSVAAPLAYVAFLTVLCLRVSSWLVTVMYIGPIIVALCALGVGYALSREEPSTRLRIAVFLLLTLAVMSSAEGPALVAGAVGAVLLFGRWRAYLLPAAAATAIYLWWYVAFARHEQNPYKAGLPGLSAFADLPSTAVLMVRRTAELTFGTPLSGILLVALVAGTIWLAVHARFDIFDTCILLTGAAIVGLTALVRGPVGLAVEVNKVYLVAVYLIVGLTPRLLAMTPSRLLWPATAMVAVLAVFNARELESSVSRQEQYMADHRATVEATAYQIAHGSPYLWWDSPSPQAHNAFLQVLISEGWTPQAPEPEAAVAAATNLRIVVVDGVSASPFSSLVVDAQVVAGCTIIGDGEALTSQLSTEALLTLDGDEASRVAVTWQDDSGSYVRAFDVADEGTSLAFPHPSQLSTVSIEVTGGPTTMCGVASAPN